MKAGAEHTSCGTGRSVDFGMRQAVLFEDGRGLIGPMTDLRPSFSIRTGALRTRDRLRWALDLDITSVWVRPGTEHLAATAPQEAPINQVPASSEPLLLLNGRLVLPSPELATLQLGEAVVDAEGDLAAACVRPYDVPGLISMARTAVFAQTEHPLRIVATNAVMISRPWHVRTHRDKALAADLRILSQRTQSTRPPPHVHVIGSGGLVLHPTARLLPGVIIDTEAGPVVIDQEALIRPAATLIGPCYIGRGTTVLDRALIKGQTAIGPHCKVAGEIGGTIFQGYSNKAHDGHLGDSWIGRWVNLGAGTTNSNLLNTYGEINARATPRGPVERTGLQFFGCVLGDHVKTAICTRIMTGTVIETGAMIAMTRPASGCIPAFSWCTDEHPPGSRLFRIDKFIEVARTVMSRRQKTMVPEYDLRLRKLFLDAELLVGPDVARAAP
jgi:UDP-N-acetylglucosamine diphosphorylase/glucosamine-1-phosphate N-acetyltransferase